MGRHPRHRHIGQQSLAALGDLGLSSIANILGAIKYAKYMALGTDDIVLTVATDGAEMYQSEIEIAKARHFAGEFSEIEAAQAFGRYLLGAGMDHVCELTRFDRERVFNLGYYTWGKSVSGELDAVHNSMIGFARGISKASARFVMVFMSADSKASRGIVACAFTP